MIKYLNHEHIKSLLRFFSSQNDCTIRCNGSDCSYSISMLFYEGCEAGHYVSHSCLLGTYNPRNGLELQEPSFYMGVGLSGRTCPMLYNDGIRSPLDTEDYSEATIEDVYGYLARARKVKRAYNAIKDILSVY